MNSKTLSFAAAMLTAVVVVPAQNTRDPSREELVRRRDSKLTSEFHGRAPWHTRYSQALEDAKSREKLVFAYFSRSFTP